MKINISPGEFIDRLTILEIKLKKIKDRNKLKILSREYSEFKKKYNRLILKRGHELENLKSSLYKINLRLWNIENAIREHEREKDFGQGFINLARKVYMNNDKRALIKNKINLLTDSVYNEIKEYSSY